MALTNILHIKLMTQMFLLYFLGILTLFTIDIGPGTHHIMKLEKCVV